MEFTISNGNAVAKASSRGGELTSFNLNGKEYVWYGLPEHWSGQAPCLFPVVCRAMNDTVSFDGKDYPMKKHGIARKTEFTPVEVTPSAITLRLTENEETLKSFPFRFNLDITHRIFENGFETEYAVTNGSDAPMPFCIGGHPGFNCPVNEGERFEDYSLVFDNAEGASLKNTTYDGGYHDDNMPSLDYIKNNVWRLEYSQFDLDAVIAENLPVKKVNLVNGEGHGIRFEFDRMDAIGFWTPVKASSPFICLEPWNGIPGDVSETTELKDKRYAKIAAPGETYKTGYRVTVI